MSRLFRVLDWSLRAKLVLLFVVASLVPLGVATWMNIQQARARVLLYTQNLLAARGDQLRGELDAFLNGYAKVAEELAILPDFQDYGRNAVPASDPLSQEVEKILKAWPSGDAYIQGMAILDTRGSVRLSSQANLVGRDLHDQRAVQEALQGVSAISDVHYALPELGSVPVISYVSALRDEQHRVVGAIVLWLQAKALWDFAKRSNGLAGPGSFAVLLDHSGVRIAHTYRDDVVFYPAGELPPETIAEGVATRRFGDRTRAYLDTVKPFAQIFAMARADVPDTAVFEGIAPVNNVMNFGVARRLKTVPWTIFYLVPKSVARGEIMAMIHSKLAYAGVILVLAMAAGWLVGQLMLRPVRALSSATQALAAGDLGARVQSGHDDELGRLGLSFNSMADRIEAQSLALQASRSELEERVAERTAELQHKQEALEAEVAERRGVERKLQSQLERFNLLNQVTHAIGERQDLRSIFQVVIRSLEDDLGIDFGCICLYDAGARVLSVACVGLHSEALAMELDLMEQVPLVIDENGLSRCMRGHLVYEPRIDEVPFDFPQRLARGGLRALVAAPLLVESQVFGALIVARKAPDSFTSGECEFLRQVSAHTALASHQAQIYGALQAAYDDLRQSQQAVMQQERLRVLGQMASGIAHDINNSLTPVMMYAEQLSDTEEHLSPKGREALTVIQRAVEDIAQTVGRMREFYRQRDRQVKLTAVNLNDMVRQVLDLTRARWCDLPQQKGVDLRVVTELQEDLGPVTGTESEIREALTNLVLNGVDAMPEGGVLKIRTVSLPPPIDGRSRPRVAIEVIDSGTGMDEHTRRRCMEPFFTTKGERGTGLGLAMVFGVAERHGAEVEIESELGRGTLFRLNFPRGAATREEAQEQVLDMPLRRLNLLIVDDDPLLLKALRDLLESDGHEVTVAHGGQAGIDAFRQAVLAKQLYDLVITDLGMPTVDGRKVASAIKQVSPETPVILLTGWGQRMQAEGEMPLNIDMVLGKPPKRNDLRLALLCCTEAQVG